jgi:hypothetical protein
MGVELYESYGFKHNGNFMQYNFWENIKVRDIYF